MDNHGALLLLIHVGVILVNHHPASLANIHWLQVALLAKQLFKVHLLLSQLVEIEGFASGFGHV